MENLPREFGEHAQSPPASESEIAQSRGRGIPTPSRPMPDEELCDRLLKALEQAALDSSHSMEALRIAVSDFTIALRDQGTTPEAVLISLKAVISERLVSPRRDLFASRRNPRIHEKISTWSIQEFFRGMAES